jgi:hypothetical protein
MSVIPRPAGRRIDPRGQRFGAFLSAIILVIATAFGLPMLVAIVAAALGVSAAFGTRWSLFGRPWPAVRRALRLGPVNLEHEYAPRFAQALGATTLVIGTTLLVAGVSLWGWLIVAGVIGLQLLLATTGYCLGCRLYFVRWWIPGLFARSITRGPKREKLAQVGRR